MESKRTKELVREAEELAQRSKALRTQVKKLVKKAVSIRKASKEVRNNLERKGKEIPTDPSEKNM